MDTGAMITCPKCGNKLPGWAQICQFCKADVRAVARPAPAKKKQYHFASLEPPKWVFPAYYGILGLMTLLNGWAGFDDLLRMNAGKGWCLTPVTMAISFAFALVCLMSALRVEIFRGILNVVCGISLALGLLDLLGGFIAVLGMPAYGLWTIAGALFRVATAAFMIFLIGETEKYAPS